MESGRRYFRAAFIASLLCYFHFLAPSSAVQSLPLLIGVHPLDERYFAPAVIKCKDGSNSFSRDRLNDDFCDCVDGTDEPGTSACPRAKFYCRNVGSTPSFIFSSRVNDQVCDCCDGSDEYGSGVNCPNTCIMGGGSSLEYKAGNYLSYLDAKRAKAKEWKHQASLEELLHKVTGLKMILLMQGFLVASVVIFNLLKRRSKAKRRRRHQVKAILSNILSQVPYIYPYESCAIIAGCLKLKNENLD